MCALCAFRRGTGAFANKSSDKDSNKGYKLRDTDLRLRKSRQNKANQGIRNEINKNNVTVNLPNASSDHSNTPSPIASSGESKRELRTRTNSRDSDRSDSSRSSGMRSTKRRRTDSADPCSEVITKRTGTASSSQNMCHRNKLRKISNNHVQEDESNTDTSDNRIRTKRARRFPRRICTKNPNTLDDKSSSIASNKIKKGVVSLRGKKPLSETVTIQMAEFTSKSTTGVNVRKCSLGSVEPNTSSDCGNIEDGVSDTSSECSGGGRTNNTFRDHKETFNEHCNLSLLVTPRPPLRPDISYGPICDTNVDYISLPQNSNSDIITSSIRNELISSVGRRTNSLQQTDEFSNGRLMQAVNTSDLCNGTLTPNKDVYEFEEEEDLVDSPTSIGLRRSSPSLRNSLNYPTSDRWCDQNCNEPPDTPSPERRMSPPHSNGFIAAPPIKHEGRVKIKLRKLHMKRSPVLDEVIAANINSNGNSYTTEYEVMAIDSNLPEGSGGGEDGGGGEHENTNATANDDGDDSDTSAYCDSIDLTNHSHHHPSFTSYTTTSNRKARRANNNNINHHYGNRRRGDDTSTISLDNERPPPSINLVKPINRHIKKVRLIMGTEIRTRTVDLSY